MKANEIGLAKTFMNVNLKTNSNIHQRAASTDTFQKAMKDGLDNSKVEQVTKKEDISSNKSNVDAPKEVQSETAATKEVSEGKENISQNSDNTKVAVLEKPVEELVQMETKLNSKLVDILTKTLDITEEELTEMLNQMGLQVLDLLKPENLNQLILQVTGTTDMMELISNPEMSAKVLNLIQDVNAINANLKQAGISLDDLKQALQKTNVNEQDVPVEVVEEVVHTEEQKADTVVENAKQQSKDALKLVKDDAKIPVENQAVQGEISEQVSKDATKNIASRDSHQMSENDNVDKLPKIIVDSEQGETNAQNQNMTDGEEGKQNLFNNLVNRLDTATQNVADVSNVAEVNKANPSDIVRQIVDQIKIQVKAQVTSMEMQLNPEHLGKISLSVSTQASGVVVAQLVAQNEQVKQAIEGQINILQQTFEQQGLKVTSIEVMVAENPFGHNFDNKQNAKQNEQNPKKNKLNNNLSNDDITEDLNLNDEEVLGQNSSVSYQA